jgi:hypothetical protein
MNPQVANPPNDFDAEDTALNGRTNPVGKLLMDKTDVIANAGVNGLNGNRPSNPVGKFLMDKTDETDVIARVGGRRSRRFKKKKRATKGGRSKRRNTKSKSKSRRKHR